MKKSILLSFVVMLTAWLTSCNSNNGDIGSLYGTWMVQSIEKDSRTTYIHGSEEQFYTWSFQNSILLINEMLPYHETRQCVASWSREGDKMTIDFNHTQSNGQNSQFTPPEQVFGVSYGKQYTLTVAQEKGDKMVMDYVGDGGNHYHLTLKKTR